MNQPRRASVKPRAHEVAERAFSAIERILHIEAMSGIVLLAAAAVALVWANSPFAESYHHLWHTELSVKLGSVEFSRPLHFWINDGLMTIFFLVVGMEIRREIHEGALSTWRAASLPIVAALGGVCVPALMYLAFNHDAQQSRGWAIPTATDIAFALGVLALLGRSIPSNVRVFLLALAIIDDIVAVLIIALFYSGGIDVSGLAIAAVAIAMVFSLQAIGVNSAAAYAIPSMLLWIGMLSSGAHPTLAGVILGLLTPATSRHSRQRTLDDASSALTALSREDQRENPDASLAKSVKRLRDLPRDILSPGTRMQIALHPWVAFVIMPLFALANAGVTLRGIDFAQPAAQAVAFGVCLALVLGKPLGVVAASWLAVRSGLCVLPAQVSWPGIWLVGLLAGIGFTMSIFIAMLAFRDEGLVSAAKVGVLVASILAASLGLAWGRISSRRRPTAAS
nr:Na+/H+ antiporter NhaA [Tahibacter aquaticus]